MVANLIKTVLSIVLFIGVSREATAQVDEKRLMNDLMTISSDSMQGRLTGSIGNAKSQAFILTRINEIGLAHLDGAFEHSFVFKEKGKDQTGKNILAFIKGSEFPDNYFVISAHYDHVGIKGGEIYNGADDNASGVAALFAIAKYFQENKPAHSLIFAFFDAEESGLKGARAFVEGNSRNISLNINLDMISRSDSREIYAAGTHQNPQLKTYVEQAANGSENLKVLFGHDIPGSGGHDWSNSSDHGPFKQAGIPFLYFGVEDHEDYHKPTDDPEKIEVEFYSSVVEMITRVIESMDSNLR